jgi:hypothetical protein
VLRHVECVVREQMEERIVGVLFHLLGKSQQALFELGISGFCLARGTAAVETNQRLHERGADGKGHPKKQQQARSRDAGPGEGEGVGQYNCGHGKDQRGRGGNRQPARDRHQAKPPLDGAQIIRQPI